MDRYVYRLDFSDYPFCLAGSERKVEKPTAGIKVPATAQIKASLLRKWAAVPMGKWTSTVEFKKPAENRQAFVFVSVSGYDNFL